MDNAEILKAVDKKILASLKARGSLRVASQRGVQKGDVAVINFVARRAETGAEISGSRQMKMHLDTAEESPFMGMESKLALDTGDNTVGVYRSTPPFDPCLSRSGGSSLERPPEQMPRASSAVVWDYCGKASASKYPHPVQLPEM